nr:trypsin-like peptidase domain-containing protein [Streptomyces sp. N35]
MPAPAVSAESAAPVPADRPRPLHDPDPYSTPPYGGPGPWAPAPPVQHPVATPAQGTVVPQGAAPVHGAPAAYPQSAQTPRPIPGAQIPPAQGAPAPAAPTHAGPVPAAHVPQPHAPAAHAPQPHAPAAHAPQPHGAQIPQQPSAPQPHRTAAHPHPQAGAHPQPAQAQPMPSQGHPASGQGHPTQGHPTQGHPASGQSHPAPGHPTPAHGHPTQGQSQPTQGQPAPGHSTPPPHTAHTPPPNGTPAHGTQAHGAQAHSPHPPAAQQPAPPNPWATYDPWRSSQPLLQSDGSAGAPKRKSRKGLLVLGAVALSLVTGGIGGGIGAYIERNGGVTEVELGQAGEESKDRAPESVAGIAASALPGVVTLHVSGDDGAGTGTGFVLDSKGHILTNNHVVDPGGGDGEISVTFSGGETASAKIVGRDAGYDLAVVKVSNVKGLKPLPLGNSDNVQVGDPVVAIGAPFDLSNTVTSGIISAKERPITAGGEADGSDVSYVNALQTDAPINPGNSGGPLVDSKARVIGINSAIRSAGDGGGAEGGQAGSIGLGFAIPINTGKRVAEQLINEGRATHPVIEVTLDTEFTGDGARVAEKAAGGGPAVKPGGPGAKAGIKSGDVVTEVDGQRIHAGEELIVKIRAHEPGDRLELTIERDGKERTLSVTLGEAGD